MIFCYVILHYKTDEDTIECVYSILHSDAESKIVIVDNASNNGSIERIQKVLQNEKRVHIVRNVYNMGFATGNNVGYEYAKNILNADFIAISNNDIIIDTLNLPIVVYEIYVRTKFYVLGPDIVSLVDGGHQNPMKESYNSTREVEKEIMRYKLLLLLSRLRIYDLIKPNHKVRTGSSRKLIPTDIVDNVMVHGSFVIFSPIFIEKEKISFRTGTFLYTEEAILRKYCDNQGYKMIFAPTVKVFHKEDSSTNSLKFSNKERREFVFTNMIKSLSVYKTYFK